MGIWTNGPLPAPANLYSDGVWLNERLHGIEPLSDLFVEKPIPQTTLQSAIPSGPASPWNGAYIANIKAQFSEHIKLLNSFGFAVDVEGDLNLGHGAYAANIANPRNNIYRDFAGNVTLAEQHRAIRQYCFNLNWTAQELSALINVVKNKEVTYTATQAGRMEFYIQQALLPWWTTTSGFSYGGSYRFYERQTTKFCPTPPPPFSFGVLGLTDLSVRRLCGLDADTAGETYISKTALAYAICFGWVGAPLEGNPTGAPAAPGNYTGTQIQIVYNSGIFTREQIDKMLTVAGEAAQKRYDLYNSPANQPIGDISSITQGFQQMFHIMTTVVKIQSLLSIAIFAAMFAGPAAAAVAPELGVSTGVASAGIAAGTTAAGNAIKGDSIGAGLAAPVAKEAGAGSLIQAAAPAVAVAKPTTSNGGNKNMDLFGINVGVDNSQVQNAISSALPPSILSDIIPASVADVASAAASAITITPAAPAASVVPSKPAASPTATAVKAGMVLTPIMLAGIGAAAYFFFFSKRA